MVTSTLASVVLVFNEMMAANVGEVFSPAYNYDSWIELYNPGSEAVNLGGMYLSDDGTNLKRWRMPNDVGSVPAGGFKVIWLGSDDIKATQAPFHLDCDGGTVYLSNSNGELVVSQSYPSAMSRTSWARQADGDGDWGWTATPTPGATNATAVFASQRLAAPVVSKGSCLFNGTLQVSVTIPEGTTLMYTTDGSTPKAPTTSSDPASPWTDFVINGDCEGDDATSLVSRDATSSGDEHRIVDGVGYNGSRGIRVHSSATAQNDHDAQFFVYTPGHIWRTGEKYRFRMKVRADKAGRINAQTHTTPHGYIHWQMFDGNAYNVTTEWQDFYYEGTITDEQVGKQGGWWGGEATVQDMQTIAFNLNVDRKDNNYYFDDVSWELYTADGLPSDGNSRESKDGKFTISSTTNLRLRLFQDGFLPSVPVTRSYIKTSNNYTLPIISIVGDKRYFTDPKTGIDCDGDGTNSKTGNGQDSPKNYNMDWDRPVNFSYLSSDGEMLFNQDVNIAVSGGWTRSQRFRSFKLKANKVFDGQNRYDYSFFPQKPYIRNKALLVRNGGNDIWLHNARFVDPALETIIQRSGIDIDVQSYVPIIEYVNGELRGVLNLREVNNDKFAYANWGYDDEELDAFENLLMKNGTDEAINRIFELGRHINDAGVYDELLTLLDIDEYTNYMAATLFLFNDDWPDNNLKGYRSQNDGRYRFVSFDLDYAFATCRNSGDNPFTFISKYKDNGNVNQEFVRLFFNLLQHDQFRRKFIDTFCIIAGSVFEPTRANTIIDELLANVQSMAQLMRQQGINDGHDPERAASDIKNRLKGRSGTQTNYMKQFAPMKLTSSTRQTVTLKSDTEGARIFVNGINVPYAYLNGYLFSPVTLRAEAPAGYRFAGWKKGSSIVSTSAEMSMPADNSLSLIATFTPLTTDEAASQHITPVRINEVSADNGIFVNEYFKRNDWVELYNTTSQPVNVEGMYLSDDAKKPTKYRISGNGTASTIIPAHGYLIVWCDKLDPLSQLHASFKLAAGGGDVLLTAADQSWTDQLTYTSMESDQTAGRFPDGTGTVYTMNIPTIAKANIISSSYSTTIGQPGEDGIMELAAATAFSVSYSQGSLTVCSQADGDIVADIYGMDGQHIDRLDDSIVAGSAQLSVGHLSKGVYVAVVTDAHGHRAVCKFAVGTATPF